MDLPPRIHGEAIQINSSFAKYFESTPRSYPFALCLRRLEGKSTSFSMGVS